MRICTVFEAERDNDDDFINTAFNDSVKIKNNAHVSLSAFTFHSEGSRSREVAVKKDVWCS